MTITLLYFAAVRELVGQAQQTVTLPSSVTTIAELAAWLERAQPPLRGRLGPVRIARNEAFAADDERISDGDVLALLPPVAGGAGR